MQVERLRIDDDPRDAVGRVRALAPAAGSVEEPVREIVERVRAQGDEMVRALTREFDTGGADPPPVGLAQDPREAEEILRDAFDGLPRELREAIDLAATNIRAVARAWLGERREIDLAQGQRVVLREVPVARAAVYVPGGRAPYPSTVLMGVEAARAAGVGEVVLCTPPGAEGDVHPAILGACGYCGGVPLLRMGGAQAIAALAYGTETIAPVDVIVGPGNLYVQEAKRQVAGVVGIDGFAGPSDLVILFDGAEGLTAIALDLLAQAEHGEESLVVAVSPSSTALDRLAAELARLSASRPSAVAPCALVEAPLFAAEAFVDLFAPEHLQLVGPEAEACADTISSAGCVFVGASSGTAFGDYVVGSNHVLPTGGAARFASGLNPGHFLRRRAEVHVGEAAPALAPAGAALARAEGFEVHAESMEARIGENRAP